VEEHVLASTSAGLDKTEAFVRNPLNFAFTHICLSSFSANPSRYVRGVRDTIAPLCPTLEQESSTICSCFDD
jgi:hypothetical protein